MLPNQQVAGAVLNSRISRKSLQYNMECQDLTATAYSLAYPAATMSGVGLNYFNLPDFSLLNPRGITSSSPMYHYYLQLAADYIIRTSCKTEIASNDLNNSLGSSQSTPRNSSAVNTQQISTNNSHNDPGSCDPSKTNMDEVVAPRESEQREDNDVCGVNQSLLLKKKCTESGNKLTKQHNVKSVCKTNPPENEYSEEYHLKQNLLQTVDSSQFLPVSNKDTNPEPPYLKFGVQTILSEVQPQSKLLPPYQGEHSVRVDENHAKSSLRSVQPSFHRQPYPLFNHLAATEHHPYFRPPIIPWLPARGRSRRGMLRRAVFSDVQRKDLENTFQQQKYIGKPDRKKLAAKLGLKDSQVKIWFQNRRMKWRNSKERQMLNSVNPVKDNIESSVLNYSSENMVVTSPANDETAGPLTSSESI